MLIAGVVLLVLAVGAFVIARVQRAAARRATATETLGCGDLASLSADVAAEVGAGSFRQRCEVVGAAEPGPDGVLLAPESGLEAVWTRTKLVHEFWEMQEREVDGHRRRERREREEVVSDLSSQTPFVVDDGSGTVLVHPKRAKIDEPEEVLDRFEPAPAQGSSEGLSGVLSALLRSGADSGTLGFRHQEWIIRPGTRLYVQGEVQDGDGSLRFDAPQDKGSFLISTRSEEEIVSDALDTAYLATIVGAVLAVVGVGLTVAGALV